MWHKVWFLVEIKTRGNEGDLTPAERKFHNDFPGTLVATSGRDALDQMTAALQRYGIL